jgi:hypothetical protein
MRSDCIASPLASAERLLQTRAGPARARLDLAVRAGLLAASRRGQPPGETLRRALHCAELVRLAADDRPGTPIGSGVVNIRDLSSVYAWIVQAHAQLGEVLDAVAGELAAADAERAPRKPRGARRTS